MKQSSSKMSNTSGPRRQDPSSRANTPFRESIDDPKTDRYFHPYFKPAEIDYLAERRRGKQTATQEEKTRQSACTFLETIGARVGFPRRTISTAQALYHRFHLYYPRKDFNYHDVCIAALYVSTKMHDTLKKPRELLAVSYAIRFPELAAKSKHPGGEVDLDGMDPQIIENDRQRLLAIERLILETISFNFTARPPFPYVIKLGKELDAPKSLIKLAWRIAIDSHRTLLPLLYPPHSIALGCLYVASLLLTFEREPSSTEQDGELIASNVLSMKFSSWKPRYHTRLEDLQDFAHTILDLIIQYTQNPSANTSPSTPSSPSPHLSHRDRNVNQQQPPPYKADQLIRLKIAMRETEVPPRLRTPIPGIDPTALYDYTNLGQNGATVRFLFFPLGFNNQ